MFCEQIGGGEVADTVRLRISLIADRLCAHPDVRCWFSFFGNAPQIGLQKYELRTGDTDFDKENPVSLMF